MIDNLKEIIIEAIKEALHNFLVDMKASIIESLTAYLQSSGQQFLILSAMFGLIFWGMGSKTGGKVVYWSIVVYLLQYIFGIYAYFAFFGLVIAKMIFKN